MDAIQRIREKLSQLEKIDKKNEVFGAEQHHYHMNQPLSEKAIISFEKRHAIKLPEEYRAFLKSVGNGGAGPGYGLFPLEAVEDPKQFGAAAFLSRPFPWNDQQAYHETYMLEEDENTAYDLAVQGSLPLAHMGCGMIIRLIVSGSNQETLWLDDRSSDYGIYEVNKSGFFNWYETWLDQELAAFETYTRTHDFFKCKTLHVEGHGRARYGVFKNLRLSTFFRPVILYFYYIDFDEFLPTDGANHIPSCPIKNSTIELNLFASDVTTPLTMEAVSEAKASYFINKKDRTFQAQGTIQECFTNKNGRQSYLIQIPAIKTDMLLEFCKAHEAFSVGTTIEFSGTLSLNFKS